MFHIYNWETTHRCWVVSIYKSVSFRHIDQRPSRSSCPYRYKHYPVDICTLWLEDREESIRMWRNLQPLQCWSLPETLIPTIGCEARKPTTIESHMIRSWKSNNKFTGLLIDLGTLDSKIQFPSERNLPGRREHWTPLASLAKAALSYGVKTIAELDFGLGIARGLVLTSWQCIRFSGNSISAALSNFSPYCGGMAYQNLALPECR